MKKLLYTLSLLLLPLLAPAQTMNVRMKDGNVRKFKINEVDYVDFTLEEEEEDDPNINPVYNQEVSRAKYEAAFLMNFGQISPNQNWGFPNNTTRGEESDRKARIIAEDMVSDDFDFNDVVFDVENEDGKWKITVLAVGSTDPIIIMGHEVHELFDVATDKMINVGAGSLELSPKSFIINAQSSLKDIVIQSYTKDNQTLELKADRGGVPAKIAVNTDYEWCVERQIISNKYPEFVNWVSGAIPSWYPIPAVNYDVVIGN